MGRDENERTMDSSQKSRDKIWSGGQQHRHTAHLSPILILLASYSFVITINPPFFTVHVTHSWRRLINQILVYYETVNTCRALAVSSQLCTYLYIFLTHSCLKCLFIYLFIHKLIIKLLHHHFASILWPFPQIWIRNSPQSSFLPFFSLYFVFKIVFPALHFEFKSWNLFNF